MWPLRLLARHISCRAFITCSISACANILQMTGYWKTDHNVTQSKVHFIVPANSHTHALPMHIVFARLSWLVCFISGWLFADPVKSHLSQWCQQRAPNGRYGLGILPIASETSLSPSGLIQALCGYFLTSYKIKWQRSLFARCQAFQHYDKTAGKEIFW